MDISLVNKSIILEDLSKDEKKEILNNFDENSEYAMYSELHENIEYKVINKYAIGKRDMFVEREYDCIIKIIGSSLNNDIVSFMEIKEDDIFGEIEYKCYFIKLPKRAADDYYDYSIKEREDITKLCKKKIREYKNKIAYRRINDILNSI